MKSNSERVNSTKLINTLRRVSDSFVKLGTPVPTSTIDANPDSH